MLNIYPFTRINPHAWHPAPPKPEWTTHVKGRKHRSQKVRSNRRKAARKAKH